MGISKYNFWDVFITTGFYSGYSKFAPGTMGAIVATLLWLIPYFFCAYMVLQIITSIAILFFTFVSVPSIKILEKEWGEDPSKVVVDEMVGVWIALLAVPEHGNWVYICAAFFLFRIFDIFKPMGVRYMERFKGGWGVMLDDILAGIYGALVILIVDLFI